MLIRHLDFFVTLAEEEHFGRAAALCGVSQPALSLAIRKLEDDLGVPLILRGQRFMGLTAEGQRVLVWGRQILADFGNMQADLTGRRKGGLSGTLRLGVSASAMPLVPALSARFEARNPLARIRIELLSAREIAAGLTELSLDAGLGWLPARSPKAAVVSHIPLAPIAFKFACSADHPFATGGAISMQDALTQPLCLVDDLPAGAVDAPAALRCASLDAVLAHLRSARWCSVVPDSFARLLAPQDDIRLLSLIDAETAGTLGAFLVRRDPPAPMVRAFDEMLATPGPRE